MEKRGEGREGKEIVVCDLLDFIFLPLLVWLYVYQHRWFLFGSHRLSKIKVIFLIIFYLVIH